VWETLAKFGLHAGNMKWITPVVFLFVFLALQPIVVVFSQPGSGF
jgi:hypothetical protein